MPDIGWEYPVSAYIDDTSCLQYSPSRMAVDLWTGGSRPNGPLASGRRRPEGRGDVNNPGTSGAMQESRTMGRLLGIDLGTSSVRVILIEPDGKIIGDRKSTRLNSSHSQI